MRRTRPRRRSNRSTVALSAVGTRRSSVPVEGDRLEEDPVDGPGDRIVGELQDLDAGHPAAIRRSRGRAAALRTLSVTPRSPRPRVQRIHQRAARHARAGDTVAPGCGGGRGGVVPLVARVVEPGVVAGRARLPWWGRSPSGRGPPLPPSHARSSRLRSQKREPARRRDPRPPRAPGSAPWRRGRRRTRQRAAGACRLRVDHPAAAGGGSAPAPSVQDQHPCAALALLGSPRPCRQRRRRRPRRRRCRRPGSCSSSGAPAR